MEVLTIFLVAALVFLLVVLLLALIYKRGYMQKLPVWTGLGYGKKPIKGHEYEKVVFEEETHPKSYELQPGKTLWDWLQLLIIPIALASVALIFNAQQQSMNQQLAQQSRQEQVVDAYIDRMSNLLTSDHSLHDSEPGDPKRAAAQAITLTALERLDSNHKSIVILFLYRADLLKYHFYKQGETTCGKPSDLRVKLADEQPVITLSQGNIEGVTINDLDLSCIDLHNTHLEGSNFSASVLDGPVSRKLS